MTAPTTSPVAAAPIPVTPTPASTGAVTYDTSIGNGVDANGFADLPLRSGAHRYFVNSTSGSDSNSCAAAQSPTTPKATLASGVGCIAQGSGDQLLVAEGRTYNERLPVLYQKGGYSLLYPTVLQSYDPTDPLNEAKYGRATSGRPVVTVTVPGSPFIFNDIGQSFIALRGFDINPGNRSTQGVSIMDVADGILIENNIFRYTTLAIQNGRAPLGGQHWIVRGNSIYGTWDDTTATGGQGIFAGGCGSLTIEDNVLWHNGWKIGASRDDTMANGGLAGGTGMFRHAVYQQNTCDGVYRRNLVADGAADGGHLLGSSVATENLIIDCPIGLDMTGGVGWNTAKPNGKIVQASYNAIVGSSDITSDPSWARGFGIMTENGVPGSSVDHNLLIEVANINGSNRHAFHTESDFGKTSYADFHDNVSYLRAVPGQTYSDWAGSGPIVVSYNNNVWDDAASGTNMNIASRSFPTAYTADQLYAALTYSGKQAFIDYAINHPEAHIQRTARSMLFAGFGIQ